MGLQRRSYCHKSYGCSFQRNGDNCLSEFLQDYVIAWCAVYGQAASLGGREWKEMGDHYGNKAAYVETKPGFDVKAPLNF